MSSICLKPKQLLFLELTILFIVTCLCSVGLFLRTNLFAYDSYAFLSYARGLVGDFGFGHELFFYILRLLPVNLLFYDFLMFGALFCSLVALYYGLRQVYGKRVSMVALLVTLGCSPILIFSFAQFQNELFAYPLIFVSFYFLMKKNYVFSVFFGLLSCVFWLGGFVWLIIICFPFFLSFWKKNLLITTLLVAVMGWIAFSPNVINSWIGKFSNIPGISYNTWGYGLFDLFLLILFVFVVFKQDNKLWWFWLGLALVFTYFSARFDILCIPFLALGVGFALKNWLLEVD